MRLDDWKTISLTCGAALWVIYIIASDAWREYAKVFAGVTIFGIVLITLTFILLILRNVKRRAASNRPTINVQVREGLQQGRKQAQDDNI